jgi:hypothetical protein
MGNMVFMVSFDCRSGQAQGHHERIVNTVAQGGLKRTTKALYKSRSP